MKKIIFNLPDDVSEDLEDYISKNKKEGFEFNKTSFIVSALKDKLEKTKTMETVKKK